MRLAKVFGINQDIIPIHNNKDIKLFSKNFTDIVFKHGQNIEKSKMHDLILKMAILGLIKYLLLIAFTDFYLVVHICQIQLNKLLSPT